MTFEIRMYEVYSFSQIGGGLWILFNNSLSIPNELWLEVEVRQMRHVFLDIFRNVFHQPFDMILLLKNHPAVTNDEIMIVLKINFILSPAHVRYHFQMIVPTSKSSLRWTRGNYVNDSSVNLQILSLQRRSQTLARSSSVHDLQPHEVFRANELDFGPIIGQGFYGIARTVSRYSTERMTSHIRLSRFRIYFRLLSGKLVR